MKYMLLVYGAENHWTEEEHADCRGKSLEICKQLAAQGQFLDASPLQSVTTATTVRVRDGQLLVTDGPFAETTEQLGGYFIVDLPNLDEAIAVASRLPPASRGTIEIRPLFPLDGLPTTNPIPQESADTPYLLLCYDDEAAWKSAGPDAQQQAMTVATALARKLNESGQYLSASPLHAADTATCVRVRDGKRVITDGPFSETHEVLGGYYLILANSREAALQIAAQHPGLRFGAVEVRPLRAMTELRKVSRIS